MGLKLGGGGGPVRETYPPLPVFPSSNSLLLLSSSLWAYPLLHTLNLHETIFQPGFKFTIFLFPNSPAWLDVEASLGPADPAAEDYRICSRSHHNSTVLSVPATLAPGHQL